MKDKKLPLATVTHKLSPDKNTAVNQAIYEEMMKTRKFRRKLDRERIKSRQALLEKASR